MGDREKVIDGNNIILINNEIMILFNLFLKAVYGFGGNQSFPSLASASFLIFS